MAPSGPLGGWSDGTAMTSDRAEDVLVDAFRADADLLVAHGERMSGPVCRAEANLGAVMVAYRGARALTEVRVPEHGEVGWLMPIVDLAMGRAALARTPSTHTCVTLSIEMEFGSAPRSGEVVRCLGRHLLDDAGMTVATCEVRGADERLLAHGSGRFVSVRGGGEPRPVPGLVVQEPARPLRELLMLERRAPMEHALLTDGGLSNPLGVVHGGAQAAMVIQVAREATEGARIASLRIDYLDSLRVGEDGSFARAHLLRTTRTMAWVEVSITARTEVASVARLVLTRR